MKRVIKHLLVFLFIGLVLFGCEKEPVVPDNPDNKPDLVWRGHANNLYSNWLNYYVYQNTPYKWGQILDEEKRTLAKKDLTQKIQK